VNHEGGAAGGIHGRHACTPGAEGRWAARHAGGSSSAGPPIDMFINYSMEIEPFLGRLIGKALSCKTALHHKEPHHITWFAITSCRCWRVWACV
jgi:hypothetical protein